MKKIIVRMPNALTGRTEEYANGDNGTVACGDCKILLRRCEAFLHEQKIYLCNDCANEEDEIVMPKRFKDLQTGDFSAFTTIDELAKDLFNDASINGCGCDDKDFYKDEKCFPCWSLENWDHVTYQQKRDIIANYDYKIIEKAAAKPLKLFELIASNYESAGKEVSVCDSCERTYPSEWVDMCNGLCPFCEEAHTDGLDKIVKLSHCPSCDSKDKQEHYSATNRTICNQCSCVYDSYNGEIFF